MVSSTAATSVFSPLQSTETSPAALLTEVFSSFQGEGPLVGERQLFVRFSHCHLKCRYCDTAMANPDGQCQVVHPHGNETTWLPNPFTPQQFVELLQTEWPKARHRHVSLTGGEPLLYHGLLAEVLPALTPTMPMYLETSGTQPGFLANVAPWINTVAMDIKLPSATGEKFYVAEHQAFLDVCRAHNLTTFAKLVVNDAVTEDELQTTIELLTPHRDTVPVFIQPESQANTPYTNLSATTLFRLTEKLETAGLNVRVVPQTHKMLQIL